MLRKTDERSTTKRNGQAALVIAKAGPLQAGLSVLLSAIPGLAQVDRTGDRAEALRLIAGRTPAVVLLDYDLPGLAAVALLKQIKANWPNLPCLVLADQAWQQAAARAAGADLALRKGMPAAALFDAINRLVAQSN